MSPVINHGHVHTKKEESPELDVVNKQ